ncbi:helix-turn-helix domain-containing protein [Fodinibius halophilus]|uniref:Bacteriophage CI repressor n=1 Tax=Fodinibius halophilus TaxID=1736908 RepID=A0A6M1T3Q8_9BACT|nr:bacteriophage CI repressor [Fodinibius halophilus]
MNTILERIKEAYHLETDADVADFLEMNPSTLSMQKNRGRINLRVIIDKCCDINLNWLLHGNGPIRTLDDESSIHVPVYSGDMLNQNGNELFKDENKLGWLKAEGDFLEGMDNGYANTDLLGYLISDYPVPPTLTKNDIAIISRSNIKMEEGIYLVSVDSTVACRRVQRQSNGNFVIRDNHLTEENITVHDDPMNTYILGKMVGAMQKNC